MTSLQTRLRDATGPDRELDGEIAVSLAGWSQEKLLAKNINGSTESLEVFLPPDEHNRDYIVSMIEDQVACNIWAPDLGEPPRFTSSVDAALELVERKLPGWGVQWRLPSKKEAEQGACPMVDLIAPEDVWIHPKCHSFSGSLPIAILTALLEALSDGEANDA